MVAPFFAAWLKLFHIRLNLFLPMVAALAGFSHSRLMFFHGRLLLSHVPVSDFRLHRSGCSTHAAKSNADFSKKMPPIPAKDLSSCSIGRGTVWGAWERRCLQPNERGKKQRGNIGRRKQKNKDLCSRKITRDVANFVNDCSKIQRQLQQKMSSLSSQVASLALIYVANFSHRL